MIGQLLGHYRRIDERISAADVWEVCCWATSWSVALGVCFFSVTASAQEPTGRFAIQDVQVFDGVEVHEHVTVVVADGFIQSVGDDPVPDGFEVVNGSGQTLLPGLIDAHNHLWGPALQQALSFGVTTVLNMSGPSARDLRREQASGQGTDRADLFSADRMAVPVVSFTGRFWIGLLGLAGVPTLTSIGEADAFVAARIAEDSDYIKIVYRARADNAGGDGQAILRALIEAAHRGGKLAVVHVLEQRAAIEAIEAGANGLVHIFGDEAPDPSFARLVADRGAFVVPTLFIHDPTAEPFGLLQHAAEAVRQLNAFGVPILAGTDGFYPGVYPDGHALHRELELLVAAGLTPREALVAATSATAQSFGLEARGHVAQGYRADLLLVRGDPTVNISATRDIVQVWKLGVPAAPIDEHAYEVSLVERVMGTLVPPVFIFVYDHPTLAAMMTLAGLLGVITAGWFGLKRWRSRRLLRRKSASGGIIRARGGIR